MFCIRLAEIYDKISIGGSVPLSIEKILLRYDPIGNLSIQIVSEKIKKQKVETLYREINELLSIKYR